MVGVVSKPDTEKKLQILSGDAKYDLACACGSSTGQHRKRGSDGRWIYPVALGNGRRTVLFKTLISNVCTNDCKYCHLRSEADTPRCSLSPTETAEVFLDYFRRRKVFGIFLSSGCVGSADATMDRLSATAEILRKKRNFRGYIHLKVLPGSSDAAIERAVALANSVSVNIETPGEKHLQKLSSKKDFLADIIRPIKYIQQLTGPDGRYPRTHQTSQFIVGAAHETDKEIAKYTDALYSRVKMHRIYFSAYQSPRSGPGVISAKNRPGQAENAFLREHRLYQVDFLLRKYGFRASELIFDENRNLSLTTDPKETWAINHPELFPVKINTATKYQLLRVPGLGPVSVGRILKRRKTGTIRCLEDIGKAGCFLRKAGDYLAF